MSQSVDNHKLMCSELMSTRQSTCQQSNIGAISWITDFIDGTKAARSAKNDETLKTLISDEARKRFAKAMALGKERTNDTAKAMQHKWQTEVMCILYYQMTN